MIDQFVIFDRGGTILWSRSFVPIKGDPVAVLVRSVLLEDRLSIPELDVNNYSLRWQLDNQRGLIFVVVFQKQLPPPYGDDLVTLVRQHFATVEFPAAEDVNPDRDFSEFSATFETLLKNAENKADTVSKLARLSVQPRKVKEKSMKARKSQPVHTPISEQNGSADTHLDEGETEVGETLSPGEQLRRRREAFLTKRGGRGRRNAGTTNRERGKPTSLETQSDATTRKKIIRPSTKSVQSDIAALDFSDGKPNDSVAEDSEARKFREQYLDGPRNEAYDDILNSDEEDDDDDDDGDEEEESDDDNTNQNNRAAGLFNYFKGLAGMRSMTREDLEPVMDKFRDGLVAKNVAKDIADRLIESVVTSLEGKTMESMTSVSTMVRRALDEALTRILTPRQSTDILAEIASRKGARPYVIAYCGVNGVGKSTSLAKTCYYLLNHGHKVMIAACDTFRAGAVEQLRTHVKCLGRGVELFDRGYGKDAAAVAADAIRKAKELKYDVVLVDTAGRMQDNEPLMRALAKLVEVNRPDRLFFVGEALVGNDAVDQLTKFNAALTDHQSGANPRLIDGIILTKFDTIDDKVGAAVSMVYTTGQPIVFIGIGQTYMDLRKMNTKSLVKALLK